MQTLGKMTKSNNWREEARQRLYKVPSTAFVVVNQTKSVN